MRGERGTMSGIRHTWQETAIYDGSRGRRCRVLAVLRFREDAVFAHPGAQGTGVYTKRECRPGFPLDAPAGFLERPHDMVLFQLGESLDGSHFQVPRLAKGFQPVQYLKNLALAGDHRPLDDTFQL